MTVLVGGPGTTPGAGPAAHDWVQDGLAALAALRGGPDWGWLRMRRPAPTAAFSRRDTLAPGYRRAADVAHRHGFDPLVRPVGGRLAVHHEGAVVLDILGRHPDPGRDLQRRFAAFGGVVVTALQGLGVDARLGRLPDEYCPGDHSVNARGRVKLVGTAQRLTKGSFWLSAVVLVSDAEPVRDVLGATYPLLGLDFDPATFGSVADEAPGTTTEDVVAALRQALLHALPLEQPAVSVPAATDELLRLPLTGCWDTAS